MAAIRTATILDQQVRDFVRRDFHPHFGRRQETFPSNAMWQRLRQLGTELWLDTGSLDDARVLWTREFSALTTNNTLLNKEVQSGQYDDLIVESHQMLAEYELSDKQMALEIAFILNARHALRLVEQFDAYVSVEEHTDLAHDLAGAVRTARRYHAICPERFFVKIPFTPAGLLATRMLADEGIAVNHTLGFSARQNYVIARIGQPRYVNVFLGRLGSFVAENKLGSGQCVGERATLASQAAVRKLRQELGISTMQIGASFRQGSQIASLAGMDVMTMPPKVSREFLDLGLNSEQVVDKTREDYRVELDAGIDPRAVGLNSLWDIDQPLVQCVDALEQENLATFTPQDLVQFFADHGCGDFLVGWSDEQIACSYEEGKIPLLANWREALQSGTIALDSLMNLAGMSSFQADQKAMDDRVRDVLKSSKRLA